jgi:hypothetical protein
MRDAGMGSGQSLLRSETARFLVVTLAGFLVALIMCFVVYPRIEQRFGAVMDPDAYGRLGQNLRDGYGLTFEPGEGPTVRRGPLYPVFVATTLLLTFGWYPGGVWLAQSLLHGLTCALVYLIVAKCWDRRAALIGGLGCAVYPMLFWYAPRLWTESLLTFLAIYMTYLCILLVEKPTILKAAGIGALIGLLSLGRGTFLPFIVALPVCFLVLVPKARLTVTLPVVIVAIAVIAPWTARNYVQTQQLIPIHTGGGLNLKLGGMCARTFWTSPFGYRKLWVPAMDKIQRLVKNVSSPYPMYDVEVDRIFMKSALEDIREQPAALFPRAVISAAMFWYIGETPLKTAVLFVLRAPVFLLAFIGIYRAIRLRDARLWPAIIIIAVYWLGHVPFVPLVRLSAPLTPIMCVFAIATLYYFWQARRTTTAAGETARAQ